MHQTIRRVSLIFILLGLGLLQPVPAATQDAALSTANLPAGVEVVASGLTNPRGVTWDDEGTLYLALAGTGGDIAGTLDDGTPNGFLGGPTSSVVSVEDGCLVPVADGLPSAHWADVGWTWGAMDVAVLNDELYVLGGGAIEMASSGVVNGIYRVADDGSTELIADLSAWFRANPPAFVPPDMSWDGSLFDLEAGDGKLWLTEAVGGLVVTVTPEGEIALAADLSEGHMVPTGLALDGNGGAYVGHETVIPYPDGLANVVHVTADGTVNEAWSGLTAMTGLAISPDGVLYAAEMATNNTEEPPYLTPDSGRIVRMMRPRSLQAVVTDISYPVGLEFGPDGMLYMTYPAWGPDAGEGLGALLRIDPSAGPISLAGLGTLPSSCADEAASVDTNAVAEAVTIADFAFGPESIEIAAGTTVVWKNEDAAPHTATADDESFDSGRLDTGTSFSQTFATPGEYAYHCAYHPMVATVHVT